jgi:hypothetical protein
MRPAVLFSAAALLVAFASAAAARMGDTVAQTVYRYGQPAAITGQPGELTSTRTFNVSGLQLICGYVGGKVVMETYERNNPDFLPPEVEAILRTESRKKNWSPGGPFVPGTYHRVDGITATVIANKVVIISPTWTDALAKDAATEQTKAARIAAGDTNAPPAITSKPDVYTSATTTPLEPTDGHRPTAADVNTTNAP